MEPNKALSNDLICAIATPPGQGGVGIVRLSGNGAHAIATQLCKKPLLPRTAVYTDFSDAGELLDNGLALLFPGPNSFTGEDVVELQGHGGPIIQHRILNALCQRGARLARPGEFSERAFMNGKLDLTQAEAVADLISSASIAASKAALNMFLKTSAIEFARVAPKSQFIIFHPGTTDTPLSSPFQASVPADRLFSPSFVASKMIQIVEKHIRSETGVGEAHFLAWDGSTVSW